MHRRWIVAVPLGLLVVGWLHYTRHGEAALSAHGAQEESAESRTASSPPFADDVAPDVAPAPSATPPPPRVQAIPLLAGGGGPAPSASSSLETLAAPSEPPHESDIQAGINAVANVDYDAAAAKFERACSHGSAFACGALGKLLATGTGLPQDVQRGRVFLTRGCTSQETWACNHLAAIDHVRAPSR
jgi:TPR repeat protein